MMKLCDRIERVALTTNNWTEVLRELWLYLTSASYRRLVAIL